MNHNLNYLFVYCTFVPAENSLNPSHRQAAAVSSKAKIDAVKDIDDDKQKLIDYSVEFATKMLTENQEFYPFAVTINLHGDLVMASYFAGDEHPLSQDLINELQKTLVIQLDS